MDGAGQHPMDLLFAEGGAVVEGREYRRGQHQMACVVYDELCAGNPLLVQAPTGVGKTAAYLAAAIEWMRERPGRRIAVVVLANALLDQIARDMPALLERMDCEDVSWSVLKGRPNYVCRDRVDRAYSILARPSWKQQLTDGEKRQLSAVIEWSEDGTGCLDDGPEMSDNVRKLVTIEASGCKSARNRKTAPCDYDADHECPFLKARADAMKADIVLTNIDLFLANHRVGGRIFGDVSAVIADEAHLLHDKVRDSYQEKFTLGIYHRVSKALTDRADRMPEAPEGTPPGKDPVFIRGLVADLGDASDAMFKSMREYAERRFDHTDRSADEDSPIEVLINSDSDADAMQGLAERLFNAASNITMVAKAMGLDPEDEDNEELFTIGTKVSKLQQTLKREKKGWAYWIEMDPKSRRTSLVSSPVRVGAAIDAMFHTNISQERRPFVAVSATLEAAGKFDFIRKQLAMPKDARALKVEGSFDLKSRCALYKLPNVRSISSGPVGRKKYNEIVANDVKNLVRVTKGKALLLTTARRDMPSAVAAVTGLGHTILEQGKQPKGEIARTFREDVNSCLIGMQMYGTGFDVPGEALELVVIWRLPFPKQSPIDVWMQKNGDEGAWFACEYMPRMLHTLGQFFGRLIRTKTDRGIVAICDPRWYSGAMSGSIRKSLPPGLRELESPEQAAQFLAEVA